MANIILPSRWTRQPQGPVEVDWSNPLTRDLVFLVNQASNINAVNQELPQGTLTEKAGIPNGIGLSTTDGANQSAYYSTAGDFGGSFTAMWIGRQLATPTTTRRLFSSWDGSFDGWVLAPNESSSKARFVARENGVNYSANLSNSITTPATYALFGGRQYDTFRAKMWPAFGGTDVAPQSAFAASTNLNTVSQNLAWRVGCDSIGNNAAPAVHLVQAIWTRWLSDEEQIEIARNPWQLFFPIQRRIYVPFSSGTGAQTLTPSLFSNTNTFYAPTITSSKTLTPGLFSNTSTFHSPAVLNVNTLVPNLYTNTNTFYNPTVTSSKTLTPSLFSNTNTIYNHVVTQEGGAQTLLPNLFSNTNTFYTHTISAGAVTLTPNLFSNTNTFYTHTLTEGGAAQDLTPNLFSNTNSFFSPTINVGAVNLTPSLLTNTNTFYSHTLVNGTLSLSQADIDAIAAAVWAHPKALTLGKFLALK